MLRKNLLEMVLIIGIFFMASLLFGCATYQHKSGTPVNVSHIEKLIKGKSTKTDVVALFGVPSLQPLSGHASPIITSGDHQIYSYTGQCVINAKSSNKMLIPIAGAFMANRAVAETKCDVLTVMLDKNEILETYSYHTDDPLNEDNIKQLQEKAEGNTKSKIIELFGAPNLANLSGNDEIFTYEKCLTITQMSAFAGSGSSNICKKLTIIFDKSTEIVKTHLFQPYPTN